MVSGSLKRRHSAPYLATLEQFAGAEKSWRGSRFWAIRDNDNDDSGDDDFRKEGDDPDEDAYNSEREFISDATRVGFSIDDLLRAESLLTENFQSPKFASVDRGLGILATHGHWHLELRRRWLICTSTGLRSHGRGRCLNHGPHNIDRLGTLWSKILGNPNLQRQQNL